MTKSIRSLQIQAAPPQPGVLAVVTSLCRHGGAVLLLCRGLVPAVVPVKADPVVAWGYNGFGQTNVPAGLSGVTAIAAGDFKPLAVKNDGTVVEWGAGFVGQTPVPAGLNGVTDIAAGGFHSVALKSNGTVVAWGRNEVGQTNVPASLSWVTAISAGAYHTLALTPVVPAIVIQPLNQQVLKGSTVTFTVGALGTNLTAFWLKNGISSPNVTPLTLVLPNVTRADKGLYSVILTNSSGSVTSAPALLGVVSAQRIMAPARLANGRYQFDFQDEDGGVADDLTRFEIQSTTEFVGADTIWTTNDTAGLVIINGSIRFQDVGSVNLPSRFYRVIEK